MGSKAPGSNLLGPPLGDWSAGDSDRENRGDKGWVFELTASKTNGGVNVATVNFGADGTAVADQTIISRRWVTPPLEAITLSGTLDLCVKTRKSGSTDAEAAFMVYAYITVGDSLDLRTVLLDNYVDAAQFVTGTAENTSFTAPQAIAGAVSAGDRIVIELGAVCSPASDGVDVGQNFYSLRYGTTDNAQATLSDATAGSTGVLATWVLFSDTIVPQAAVAPPANDACADAVVVSSTPYVSPRINTTQSADTERAVWYSYTAEATQRYFASSIGSNYAALVTVYSGGCGALVEVGSSAEGIGFQGSAQSVASWSATQGVTYLIAVTSYFLISGQPSTVATKNSGGSLVLSVFPQLVPDVDDLIVNCQHVAVVRSGQLINLTDRFYGFTPTASAIDYTERSMDDLNGGTNTSRRVFLGLFGTTVLVEVLDLDTLNVGDSDELAFMLDAVDTGGENLSALVFSSNTTGTLYLGFYGDEYSVAGGTPSTAASTAVRFLDGTHTDNQTGAPWPVADEWNVLLQSQGSDFIDLAADQTTLYYTSAGTQIMTIDVTTGVQGSTYATVPPASGPRPGLRGLRVLPPGDGSNGVLVAAGSCCYWIGPLGNILQTYNPSPADQGQDIDKLEITNSGETFWCSDQYSTYLFHFDITSGTQLDAVNLNFPPGQLCGFSIVNGYRGSTGTDGEGETPPSPPEPSPYLGFATELPIRWVLRTPVIT
jgi:hypothetical protein